MNVADTERATTRLRAHDYIVSDSPAAADIVLFNTCSVRERAAHKVLTRIGEVRKQRRDQTPLIGVMGCVAQLEGELLFEQSPHINFVVGTRATDRLPAIIEKVLEGQGKVLDLGERAEGESLQIATHARHSAYVGFVPIIEGCNKFCSYCIVPFSRGREKSRLASEIIADVSRLRDQGFREVHLIGQNVNSYRPALNDGFELFKGATPFSRLLRAVAATGIERIKFTTSFPRDFHEDIVSALDEHENLCNWVHLPVQSGSDKVLRAMRRGYKVSDYLRCVENTRRAHRRISLTSDIIIGFPSESSSDFKETLKLVQTCRFDGLYIFKYSERPRTPSAKLLDDVGKEEKASRFLELERLQREVQRGIYLDYVGETLKVLVEGVSTKSLKDMTGHTTCHKVVNFAGNSQMLGSVIDVQVTESKINSLYGKDLVR